MVIVFFLSPGKHRTFFGFVSSFSRLGIAVTFLLICISCRTVPEPPPLTYSAGSSPVFSLVYHPYGPGLDRTHGSPVPDYAGWSDERMVRDLRLFRDVGIRLICISIDVADLDQSLYRDRLRRFFSYAEGIDSGPALSVLVTLPGGTTVESCDRSVRSFADWLLSTELNLSSAFYRIANRPLIVLGPSIDSPLISHPAFTFRRTNGNAGSWSLLRGRKAPSPAGPERQITISPRQPPPPPKSFFQRSPLPSELRAEALRADIWRAFRLQAEFIIIDAWNDFSCGRYVEPDRLYGSRCLAVLSEEISRIRAAP